MKAAQCINLNQSVLARDAPKRGVPPNLRGMLQSSAPAMEINTRPSKILRLPSSYLCAMTSKLLPATKTNRAPPKQCA